MKISMEWAMEFLTAIVLFGIIFVSVHIEKVSLPVSSEGEYAEVGQHAEKGKEEKQETEEEEKQEESFLPEEHQISGFDITLQEPELPTGCEITSLTMVLNYYGLDADKVTMATVYLPSKPAEFYYDDEGNLYGADMECFFVGDPTTEEGYICGAEAIRIAADKYLHNVGSPLQALDKTGSSVDDIYRWVSEDIPVVVWVTINMEERNVVEGWLTESGGYVDWGKNDHGAVLIGYTQDTVTIADPITGKVLYDRENFEEIFASRGNQCVILK